jgi:hypothetical protein
MGVTLIKEKQEVERMAAEERAHGKEAAWKKEQQEEERVIVDQRACKQEASESEIC